MGDQRLGADGARDRRGLGGATKDAFEEAGKEISEEVSEAFKKEDAKAKAK